MSYDEYFDLYLSAQENPDAPYYVVAFDIVDSKKMPQEKHTYLIYNFDNIMRYVYNKLLERQKELKRQVVIPDERFKRPWEAIERPTNQFIDPVAMYDSFYFTVLRGTVTKEEIMQWVNEYLAILNIEVSFHVADGYYETNEYGEGSTKFYRIYCLNILEKLNKPHIKEKLRRRKRARERKKHELN